MATKMKVTFQPEGKRAKIKSGETIFQAARLVGADLTSICGGRGECGKCKVIVEREQKNVESATSAELALLSPTEMSEGYRLACRTSVKGDLTVRIPEESRTGRQRLQVEGIETPVKLDPAVSKYFLTLSEPSLQDPTPDLERLLQALESQHGLKNLSVKTSLLQRLPVILRDSEWKVTVTVSKNDTLIGVELGDTTHRLFGYAVDMGTTKLAGYLLNLNTGKVVAVESKMNPQIPYGEDVITRITYAMNGAKEQKELQQALVNGINQMLRQLSEKTNVKPEEVYEMVAVGNTAMHHLFLNICPKFLALSPYAPVIKKGIDVEAQKIGVNMNPNGNIRVLPVIAGFVGADAVAVMLATEIHKRNELCMALDIGTNTEVILGNKNKMFACSCASGPALEGAHIKHGMRAASGAIEKVKIDPKTLEVHYWTIDNAKPCGICGSAMVDILSEMLKAGIIEVTGAMNRNIVSRRLREGATGLEFVLSPKEETVTREDIVVTQKDIMEIQLAKAAIHTGATTLMRKNDVAEADIDIVFIAGAFGSYIDPVNARIIGMYPEVPLEKVKVVGNAAGTGARMTLVSKAASKTAEEISNKVKYVELAAEPGFQPEFFNSYALPYADLSKYPQTSELLKVLGKYPKKPPIHFPA